MARSRYRISYKKELYYILCIVALVVIMVVSILGPGGYRELRKMRSELYELNSRVKELQEDNNKRRQFIEELRNSKEAQEKYAREKGGYGKPGEIIQQVPEEKQNSGVRSQDSEF